jgi:hypothetical protein
VFVFLFFLMLNSCAKLRNISALTQSFIQQALERAQRMIAEGVFGKRAQRELRERINEQNTQPAQHDLVRTA